MARSDQIPHSHFGWFRLPRAALTGLAGDGTMANEG
jgi:hypothetical protein